VLAYLKRLVTTGAAYQAGDLVSKALAIFTLPLYTRYVSTSQYGYAETLLTQVILVSILLRLGVGEAFVRFWYDDDDTGRRARMISATVVFVALSTTLAGLAGLVFAGPLSQLQLGVRAPDLAACALLGLWAFTNLEIAYSLLRVEQRAKTYIVTSVSNVVISIALTVYLVVVRRDGAEGLLLGNFAGSTAVLLALWWVERRRIFAPLRAGAAAVREPLRRMLGFGLPTVPADVSVYALQVIDRAYLLRADSPAAAGLYAVAAKIATVVFVAVRGFQYAWPPLAYSVTDDDEAARLYSLVTTYYLLATGVVVAGVALLGRWALVILAAPKYVGADAALPWLALGWALYGLYLVFVVIAGRTRAMARNLPAAFAGLLVNVIGIVVLVPALGIAGAGIALCVAYSAMLVVIYALTRQVFSVGFEWGRLARLVLVLGGVGAAGDLLLPSHGLAGFASRAAAFLVMGPLLVLTGFVRRGEWERARTLLAALRARLRRRAAPSAG
jgi:O-antigen/teichoic acid export membrane protein